MFFIDIFDTDEKRELLEKRLELFSRIKKKAFLIKKDAEKKIANDSANLNFYHRMILDNTICEYNNFISLIEGFERDSNS